jgi:hypothetical protein
MASNLFADTTGFSSRRGSNDWLRTDNQKSDTRAIPAADPNNRLEYLKAIVQPANVEGETIPLKEVIPFWFAVSSPLLGMLLGLLGAWFVAWLSV